MAKSVTGVTARRDDHHVSARWPAPRHSGVLAMPVGDSRFNTLGRVGTDEPIAARPSGSWQSGRTGRSSTYRKLPDQQKGVPEDTRESDPLTYQTPARVIECERW